MTARQHRDNGFTLIEVLLVVMILGLLAAVVVFSVRGTTDRGENAACDTDARILATAAEAFFAENRTTTIPSTGSGNDQYEATLADQGFLRAASEYYDLADDGSLAATPGSSCTV
jgi:general secretion pathway protein G